MNRILSTVRDAVIFAAPVAAFWAVWHLITGSVPSTTVLEFTEAQTITLPFPVSRWWDVAGVAVFAAVFSVFDLSSVKNDGDKPFIVTCAASFFLTGIASQALHSLYLAAGACVIAGAGAGVIIAESLKSSHTMLKDIKSDGFLSLIVWGGLLLSAGLANSVAVMPFYLLAGLLNCGLFWRLVDK